MSGTHKSIGDTTTTTTTTTTTSSNAKLEMTSPFQALEKLSASVSYDNDRQRYGLDGKVTLGRDKSNAYYSTLNALKPLSPGSLRVTWSAGTPLPGLRKLEASVEHSADSGSLSTVLKASKGRRSQVQVTVTGSDRGVAGVSRDLSGDLTVKSDVSGLEDVTASLTHKDDGRQYELSGAVTRNNDR